MTERDARPPRYAVEAFDPSRLTGTAGPLPRSARVLRRWEFQKIHREGVRVHGRRFTLVARRTLGDGEARIGCAISRKVGSAVRRNRVRRVLKEFFRCVRSDLPAVDVVFIAKVGAADLAAGGLIPVASELWTPLFEVSRRALLAPAKGKNRKR